MTISFFAKFKKSVSILAAKIMRIRIYISEEHMYIYRERDDEELAIFFI